MTKVVVSWAGSRGQKLGSLFYRILQTTATDLQVDVDATYSPINMPIGEHWRSALRDILRDADFGVILLEPAALNSLWVAYEAGFLDGGSDVDSSPPVLHPFVFAIDPTSVADTPFDSLQCVAPTREHIEEFCRTILTHANGAPARPDHVETFTDRLHPQLEDAWARIRAEESATHYQLRQSLYGLIDSYEAFGLIQPDLVAVLKNLLTVLRPDLPESSKNTTVAFELSEIARFFTSFAEASQSSDSADAEFSSLATDWAINHLVVYAHEQLADIANGRLPVKNRAPVRHFWQHHVFGRAQHEIWTTNVGRPGDTMGGAPTQNLLEAQEAAIARDVKVTRVFVYDPAMSDEEARDRRTLMRLQIDAGIDVRIITTTNFTARADSENAERNIGSTDFMIIDGAHVYLTYPAQNDEISAEYVNGTRHSAVRDAALEFRHVINHWSHAITERSVDQFPRLRPERMVSDDGTADKPDVG
jgi:hypothetical protein